MILILHRLLTAKRFSAARGRGGAKSGFFRRDKAESGPVEIAVTACDSGYHPIPNHTHRRHWNAGAFCFSERKTYVFERQRHNEPRLVALCGNLVAVDFMNATAKIRTCHKVEEGLRIKVTLSDHCYNFCKHLQCGGRDHIAQKLEEICVGWIGADHE